MVWRVSAIFIVVIALAAGAAEARRGHSIDATPFSHAPCSVLARHPCTPYYCSVFNRGPAFPRSTIPMARGCAPQSPTLWLLS